MDQEERNHYAIGRRQQLNNHSLADDFNNNEESLLRENQKILTATEPLLGSPKGRDGPFGIIGRCARRMSFDRRRRSSASRRPSSPALVPNKSSSAIPNMNSLIEPTVFARAGTCSMPHPDKFEKGGEDANIVCIGPDGSTLTAVLDGVGGWAAVGVDSGKYSRALAERIGIEFDAWHDRQALKKRSRMVQSRSKFIVEDQRPLLCILERAFDYVDDLGIQGTCTACLSLLFPNGKLHVLNLGDSGLRVVRENKVVFATIEQQLGFNYPRQIGTGSTDIPADGDYSILDVYPGDTIVSGSDGVWDNVWEHEYLPLLGVGKPYEYSAALERTARRIAEAAHRRGMDPYYLSPFASNGMQAGIPNCLGGKLDDTTVVVQRVWDNVTIASA